MKLGQKPLAFGMLATRQPGAPMTSSYRFGATTRRLRRVV